MRPLIRSDRRAQAVATTVSAWLLAIELGTSRRATRLAARTEAPDDVVVDTTTGRMFDVAAVVAVAGGVLASLVYEATTIRQRRATFWSGAALLVSAGLVSSWSRRHLGRFHRDALTIHGDHEVIDTGPYARIRHPLYTATITAFVGIGAVLGTWISLALAALPAGALIHRILVEERMLVEALADDYVTYANRTSRLVPGIW